MADKPFGIEELKIIGSGTPTISSPGDLDIDANLVNISDDLTAVGDITAAYFYGDGSNLTNVTASSVGSIDVTANITIPGSNGEVLFNDNSSLGAASKLFYDSTLNRVGVNTIEPQYQFEVRGDTNIEGTLTVSGQSITAGGGGSGGGNLIMDFDSPGSLELGSSVEITTVDDYNATNSSNWNIQHSISGIPNNSPIAIFTGALADRYIKTKKKVWLTSFSEIVLYVVNGINNPYDTPGTSHKLVLEWSTDGTTWRTFRTLTWSSPTNNLYEEIQVSSKFEDDGTNSTTTLWLEPSPNEFLINEPVYFRIRQTGAIANNTSSVWILASAVLGLNKIDVIQEGPGWGGGSAPANDTLNPIKIYSHLSADRIGGNANYASNSFVIGIGTTSNAHGRRFVSEQAPPSSGTYYGGDLWYKSYSATQTSTTTVSVVQGAYNGVNYGNVNPITSSGSVVSISSMSNAYGTRYVASHSPPAGEGSPGDIWYVI